MQNSGYKGIDWTTWDGKPCGYEGYLADVYYFLPTVLLREPPSGRDSINRWPLSDRPGFLSGSAGGASHGPQIVFANQHRSRLEYVRQPKPGEDTRRSSSC